MRPYVSVVIDDDVRQLVLKNVDSGTIKRKAGEKGMLSLLANLLIIEFRAEIGDAIGNRRIRVDEKDHAAPDPAQAIDRRPDLTDFGRIDIPSFVGRQHPGRIGHERALLRTHFLDERKEAIVRKPLQVEFEIRSPWNHLGRDPHDVVAPDMPLVGTGVKRDAACAGLSRRHHERHAAARLELVAHCGITEGIAFHFLARHTPVRVKIQHHRLLVGSRLLQFVS